MGSTSADRMRALRARKAGETFASGDEPEPGDGSGPPGEDDRLTPAVEATLAALDLGPADAAAAQVALRYAQIIDRSKDQAWALRWIGPHLLEALQALKATPMTRQQKPLPPGVSRLDQLRATRRP